MSAVGSLSSMDRREIVEQWTDDTSALGLIFLKKSRTYLGKAIWIIALLAMWIISAVQVTISFKTYFEYRTTVAVQIKHTTNSSFPAVSICNVNPIRMSYYEKHSKQFGALGQRMEAMLTAKHKHDPEFRKLMKQDSSDVARKMLEYVLFSENINITKAGHRLKDMLVECNFLNSLCGTKNFTQWEDANYGNCYTIFFKDDSFSTFSGPNYGAKFILYAEPEEYLAGVTSEIGFRVQVHYATYPPFPQDQGFSISPGSLTSVAIKEVRIKRQPLPYDETDCGIKDHEMSDFDVYRYWNEVLHSGNVGGPYDTNYTSQACVKQCYLKVVSERCNCIDPAITTYKYMHISVPPEELDKIPPACNLTNLARRNCMIQAAKHLNDPVSGCEGLCPQPCVERLYQNRITSTFWPNSEYFDAMIGMWKERVPSLRANTSVDAAQNLAKLEVYFEEHNYESVTESPAMTGWDLLTDIGGIFGLYTGICFLTILEIIELAVRICTVTSARKISSRTAMGEKPKNFGEDLNPPKY